MVAFCRLHRLAAARADRGRLARKEPFPLELGYHAGTADPKSVTDL